MGWLSCEMGDYQIMLVCGGSDGDGDGDGDGKITRGEETVATREKKKTCGRSRGQRLGARQRHE
jgi:hypothetical protein